MRPRSVPRVGNVGRPSRSPAQGSTAYVALVCFGARSPGLHELLLPAGGNGIVMTELHRVGALTSGESFEAELIFGDFR